MVALADLRQARERIKGVAIHTPLLPAKFGPQNVYFKCENLQRGGAFEIRGAYNNLAALAPGVRARGVVAYSSGNHAQAVALSAKLFGVPATIVMLTQSVAEKVSQTKVYGAEAIFGGDSSEKIKTCAERIAGGHGMTLIPPFNHPGTIAGQGTVGLEILEDLPELKAVVVPIGGGGLISGIATAVKELCPRVRVIGVEPSDFDLHLLSRPRVSEIFAIDAVRREASLYAARDAAIRIAGLAEAGGCFTRHPSGRAVRSRLRRRLDGRGLPAGRRTRRYPTRGRT